MPTPKPTSKPSRDANGVRRTPADAPIEPKKKGETLTEDEKVDEAARESMGTSDPPSFTPSHAGKPKRDDEKKNKKKK